MRDIAASPSTSQNLLLFFDLVDSIRALIRLFQHYDPLLSQVDRDMQAALIRTLVRKFHDPHLMSHLNTHETHLFLHLRDEVLQQYEPTSGHDIWIK